MAAILFALLINIEKLEPSLCARSESVHTQAREAERAAVLAATEAAAAEAQAAAEAAAAQEAAEQEVLARKKKEKEKKKQKHAKKTGGKAVK